MNDATSMTTPYTTPGPWAIDWVLSGNAYWVAKAGTTRIVARVNESEDAKLIAAAPELLAMLRKLVGAIDRMPSNPADGLADAARELIAKVGSAA